MSNNDELQANDLSADDAVHEDAVLDAPTVDDDAHVDEDPTAGPSGDAVPDEDMADDTDEGALGEDAAPSADAPSAEEDAPSGTLPPVTLDAPATTERTFGADYTPEPIPKTGVVLAALTLLVAAGGLVYYILFPPSQPVFTVNGESTSQEELVGLLEDVSTGELAAVAADPEDADPAARAQLAQLLSTLIVDELLRAEADDLGLQISDEEIGGELDTILAEGFGGDQAAFDDAIAQSGLTDEGIQQQVRTTLLVEALAEAEGEGSTVSEEDIQAAYDAQFSSGTVSHILVETEAEANDVLDRLDAGESFADLAMELSLDPGSGAAGGDLGPFQPGAFVPEFEEAVLATSPGEITGPVETQFGFHIITVNEPPALDEVRDLIEQGLQGQAQNGAIQGLLSRLDAEAEVTVAPEYGEWVGLLQGGVLPPQAAEPETLELPAEDGQ